MVAFARSAGTLAAGGIAGFALVVLAVVLWRPTLAIAQPATLLAPPSCTCSAPVSAAGHELINCACGALQCVIVGKGAAVQPALVCTK